MRFYTLILFLLMMFSCNGTSPKTDNKNKKPSPKTSTNSNKIPVYTYEIVNEYKHDKRAFTQGLIFRNGFLYESTGQYNESTLRKVNFETGKVLQKHDVPNEFFAEGITLLGNEIFQLTWQSGVGFVYDANTFKLLREFRYSGEGWGLATDGKVLFHSDGTHVIRVVNPKTYETIRSLIVKKEDGKPLYKLNELEFVKGEIWANVWHSEKIGKPNHIARISPENGKLLGWLDLNNISPGDIKRDSENTLNGIAYDEENDRIFVTGKNWKKLFEIKVLPKE